MTPEAKTIEAFDPNAIKSDPWASFIPWRTPQFKVHSRRQDALSAISTNKAGVLYTRKDGRWQQVTRKLWDDHVGVCSHCGGSTLSDNSLSFSAHGQTWHTTGRYSLGHRVKLPGGDQYEHGTFSLRRNHGRIVEPPEYLFLCPSCLPRFSR